MLAKEKIESIELNMFHFVAVVGGFLNVEDKRDRYRANKL